MFERVLNAFWILLGAAAAAYAWTLGVVGPAGPESGLFPLIAGLIVMAAGIVLFVSPSTRTARPDFPRGAGLARVLGVVAGLVVLALGTPYLGFAVTGLVTMIILLRTVEQTNWPAALALALATVVAIVWLFGHVLGMVLPRGPWGF